MSSEAEPPRAPAEEPGPAALQRAWVILHPAPLVVSRDHAERIEEGADFAFDLDTPPRCSRLLLPRRIAPADPKGRHGLPRVVAVDGSGFVVIVHAAKRDGTLAYYLCDTHTRRATRHPRLPASLGHDGNSSGLGVVVDSVRGRTIVAMLRPDPASNAYILLRFDTESGEWSAKQVLSTPQQPGDWIGGGGGDTISYGGKLCWVDVAHGMLSCDPFQADPDLTFMPLPDRCNAATRILGRRRISVSEGKFRCVELVKLADDETAVRGWSMEGADAASWTMDFMLPLSMIWPAKLKSMMRRKSRQLQVALVSPAANRLVFLSSRNMVFVVDVVEGRTIQCLQMNMEACHGLYAWEIEPEISPFPAESLEEPTSALGGTPVVRCPGIILVLTPTS
ncbi:hypothetical protein QOZ80_1BG0054330 [Eleusine coracana subsp. coracana]|nr:hypothetical protein QOZ80_1BG0054330 [Eleusine coracana subsp. coracana]